MFKGVKINGKGVLLGGLCFIGGTVTMFFMYDAANHIQELREEIRQTHLLNKPSPISAKVFEFAQQYMDTCSSCNDTAGYIIKAEAVPYQFE